MSANIQRAVIGCAMAVGLAVTSAAAQSTSKDVTWLWTGGGTMACSAIGKRNLALNAAAVAVARRLADSQEAAARWIGRDALRELTSPAVTKRLKA